MKHSSIYSGVVYHQRRVPVEHSFQYRLDLMYLDLDEVEHLPRRDLTFSLLGPSLFRFDRKNFCGNQNMNLKDAVLEKVSIMTELSFTGQEKVRVLTQCKVLGYSFNPVSLYYIFDELGEHWLAVMAEINNTPWDQRHQYACVVQNGEVKDEFLKAFHVSPFMSMNQTYKWFFSQPSEHLSVVMRNFEGSSDHCFEASLTLERKAWSHKNLWMSFFRVPFSTVKTISAIYWHAARLKIKGVTYHAPPSSSSIIGDSHVA